MKTQNSKGNNGKKGILDGIGGSAHDTGKFSWQDVDGRRLAELIDLITSRGGAVRFGYSRDGNAGSVGVYYGEERNTLYFRPNCDYDEVIGVVERLFGQLPNTEGRSPTGTA